MVVCADKKANTLEFALEGRNFAVNLLAAGQEPLSNKFASKKEEWTRFEGLDCGRAETGAPLIPGALVSLDCALQATHDEGDHILLIGRVEAVVQGDGEPLLHYHSQYGRFVPEPGA